MKRVLIIGMGYLGKALGHLLCEQYRSSVWGVKRNHSSRDIPINDTIDMIWHDLNTLTVQHIPEVDAVVYCPSPDQRQEQAYRHIYQQGLKHCLTLCQKMKHKPRFILVSSTSVYAQNDGSWVNEHSPCEPNNPLSQIIAEGEAFLDATPYPSVIIRASGIYGPHRHYLLDALLQGNGKLCHDTRYSNRIHVHDLAQAIAHVIYRPTPHNVYIATDSEPTPINTIVGWLSSTTGMPLPEKRSAQSMETMEHRGHKRLSNALLLETGFTLAYPNFKQGFKDILIQKGLITAPDVL